ncbi:MAG: hypothetical protein ACOH2D_07375 [Gelidibacter sp.]|uniref:hypothetical protein n=1 Tax=Gelidibacter sp. TaxID=2018083 RepID=UPI003263509D
MKTITLILAFLAFSMGWSQDLPTAVTNSFNKLFPTSVISSWTDNSFYNYEEDWDDDIYYNDFDYDGFEDGFYSDYDGFYDRGFGRSYDGYYEGGYGWRFPYYGGYGYEYNVPVDYVIETKVAPTYYQLSFTKDDIKMTGIFKPDGTFIMAKGRIRTLPSKVSSAVMAQFKGKTIRFGGAKELIIVPANNIPVYRFKVDVKHAKNHIMKVDGNGKIVSDTVR